MTRSSRIALITVLFNCEKHLPLFFECMGKQTDQDYLIIVIDNASKDPSLARARTLAQAHNVPCEFIANDDNLGIAVGNNQGIERARELGMDHLVLINNDIGCEPDLISNIRARAIHGKHKAWTCLAYYGDSSERWYGGGRLSYWLARGIHYDQSKSETIHTPVTVSYAPTCLMYVHASVFDEVGLMDPEYFVYYDDTDFCRRMHDASITLVYDPTVSFKHYVGGSSGGDLSPFFLRISTRNKFLYIRKHYLAPMRWLVSFIALGSKIVQLTSKRRRGPTWEGLREAFSGR
jgi:GT2 family glycosyltransferase